MIEDIGFKGTGTVLLIGAIILGIELFSLLSGIFIYFYTNQKKKKKIALFVILSALLILGLEFLAGSIALMTNP